MRITNKDLENVTERINHITDSPPTSWTRNGKGLSSNIDNYHLSNENGGVSLHRMVNTVGGIEDVFRCGHVPKRELYDKMHAFITGYHTAK